MRFMENVHGGRVYLPLFLSIFLKKFFCKNIKSVKIFPPFLRHMSTCNGCCGIAGC